MIKSLAEWIIAMMIAAVIWNGLLFFYYRPTGWIERVGGATTAIWEPNTSGLMGTEGYGIYHVDKKGYVNADLPLDNDYILVVGASYTQGKEVMQGKRYTDLLNEKMAQSKEKLKVYNVSQDAYFFPDIVKGFSCITGEFKNADTIVIEIARTDFSEKSLKEAIEQRSYQETSNGENIISILSLRQKAILKVKKAAPLISLIKKQYEQCLKSQSTLMDEKIIDLTSYKELLNQCLSMIRSEYDGNLIIMYHPTMEISADGTIIMDEPVTNTVFADLCRENKIRFVDMTKAFKQAYDSNHIVPYGFSNTTMGNGHFNKSGHKIIADELYKTLKGAK